ncbi:hypothetical protein PWT90_04799 [Aphanocladium album]|nr:hypothetical protein PWT90_04799 [Aphanocladium album]
MALGNLLESADPAISTDKVVMLLMEFHMLPVSLEVGDADVTSSDDMDGGEVIVEGVVETSAALHRQLAPVAWPFGWPAAWEWSNTYEHLYFGMQARVCAM